MLSLPIHHHLSFSVPFYKVHYFQLKFELTRYHTESIMLRLYILGFLPPELLLEKPTEVSSNSPEERILEICSLTVACLTSNN